MDKKKAALASVNDNNAKDVSARLKAIDNLKEWAKAYIEGGMYVVPMRYRDNIAKYKMENFPQKYIQTPEEVDEHVVGNIALLHEPSGTCALDIDNLELTRKAFASAGIDIDELCKGAWQSTSSRPNSAKYWFEWPESAGPLFKTKQLAWPDSKDPQKREVIFELRGDSYPGDVVPPSISPKTGKAYQWVVSPFESPGKELPKELLDIWTYWNGGMDGQINRVPEKEIFKSYCPWDDKSSLTAVMPKQKTDRNYSPDAKTIIEKFNQENDVVSFLESHGYKRKSGLRFYPPGSNENHEPGVSVLPSQGGYPMVYSHHGSDVLADGYAHDAFSLYKILQWGGDFNRAINELSEEYGIKVRKSKTLSEKELEKRQADTRVIRSAIEHLHALKDNPKDLADSAEELYTKIFSNAYVDDALAIELTEKLRVIGLEEKEVEETKEHAREQSENPYDVIEEFNQTHAVIAAAGGVKILRRGVDVNGQPDYQFMGKGEAQMLYANRLVSMGGDQKKLFDVWLQSPIRNTYTRLGMNPRTDSEVYESHCEKCLNIYKGSPYRYVVPDERVNIDRFLNFIKEILCDGNEEAYEYLLNWCAHLVQKPWEMPGVAILMMSAEEGTGKGFFASCVGKLMPAHYYRFDSLDQITEKHNEHLQHGIVMFCDEATYGGDKKSEGILRGLITDPDVTINPKFGRQFQIERYTRLIISSNNRWPAPIQASDRRYFVLRPNPKYAAQANPTGNERFYGELRRLMDNPDGMASWYSFLKERDISQFSPRRMPNTSAMDLKQEISMKSMGTIDEYLVDMLTTNAMPGARDRKWKDVIVPRGPMAGSSLGPFCTVRAIKDAMTIEATNRRLRPPTTVEVKARLLELGICEMKRNNGKPGFRFLPYDQCVQVFCHALNIDESMITGGDDEDFIDEDLNNEWDNAF